MVPSSTAVVGCRVTKKIDEAFFRLRSEAEHHVKLSQVRDDDFENGFAQGMSEAFRIVASVRDASD